jgi:CarD family transcriptional regulator
MSPAEDAAERSLVAETAVAAPETATVEKAAAPRPKSSGQSFASKPSFASRGARPQPSHAHARSDAGKGTAGKAGPTPRQGFKAGEFIVYPAHGVGEIVAIEEEEVAGFKLELFVISFAKDKMKLKVPVPKVASVGMRKLSEADVVQRALDTLAGRARVKRTMWSRRAQEYEAKINSGDLVAVAEVVRDLYRSDAQPEQSYSERQLYEAALDRMAREIAAVQKLTDTEVLKLIETQLQKSPRRGKAEADVEVEVEIEDGDIEEAA